MTDVEARLRDALTGAANGVRPAPDLFARVRDVVADDRRRRRRRRAVLGVGVALAVVATAATTVLAATGAPVAVAVTDLVPSAPFRGGTMSWWVLELLTNALLVGLALWLGPFIKRFGRAYAADVSTTTRSPGRATSCWPTSSTTSSSPPTSC
ncbi:hypothetical protein [Aquipuribacter nitratireducens]|uniref:Uncharacterized protein n=1 Tax=Aquipuribacter nitratireducens TaxID=650104 RepID=A0ABW0GHR3_9MICO